MLPVTACACLLLHSREHYFSHSCQECMCKHGSWTCPPWYALPNELEVVHCTLCSPCSRRKTFDSRLFSCLLQLTSFHSISFRIHSNNTSIAVDIKFCEDVSRKFPRLHQFRQISRVQKLVNYKKDNPLVIFDIRIGTYRTELHTVLCLNW